MPYNSETSQYERRATTVIDATPDGDTVAVAIDVKLDQGIDDYVSDLNHHAENGNHYPETSVGSDSRFLRQSPAGVVSWANGVVAADAALKDMSNVASAAIAPAKIAQDASNRFMTDTERTKLSGIEAGAQVNVAPTKEQVETVLTGEITSHVHDVGAIVIATGDAAPAGTIPGIGSLLSRATYSRLWAYAQASGNIVADGSWTKGKYSTGDGSTTFRTPNLQDQFIRGASGTRAVGNGEEDEFKSHTHVERVGGTGGANLVPAALATGVNNVESTLSTSATGGDETRPKNVAYLVCIRY